MSVRMERRPAGVDGRSSGLDLVCGDKDRAHCRIRPRAYEKEGGGLFRLWGGGNTHAGEAHPHVKNILCAAYVAFGGLLGRVVERQ